MKATRYVALATLLLSGFLHVAQPAAAATQETPTSSEVQVAELEAQAREVGAFVVWSAQVDAVVRYVQAVEIAEEAARQAEAQAALERERAQAYVAPQRSAPTVAGACGGATNGADQFIQRESGGNPNIYNSSSGAWGCYQLMPMHFAPGGTCSDMTYGAASPAQQAECASRLPLSAWAL